MEIILYFYTQEALGFLFLLGPSLSWATRIVLFKGGFGPYFLWLMLVMNSLDGIGLVHFLSSIKLPYYGVLLGLETVGKRTLLLGVFLRANLLFLLNRVKVLLFLRGAERRNLMLLNNQRELVCLLVLVYTRSLIMTVRASANPSEVTEGALNFVRLPITTAFSLKLAILNGLSYNPTTLLLILSLWVRIIGGTCFILTTLINPYKILKRYKGWTNGLALFILILLL